MAVRTSMLLALVPALGGCPGPEPFLLGGLSESCPDDAPVVGQEGGFGIDTFTLAFEPYDPGPATGVSRPVHVRIPDDIVSYAITVDSGTRQVALGTVRVGDDLLIDIDDWDAPRGHNTEPFFHTWATTSTLVLPTTRATQPTPGCLSVVAVTDGDASADGTTLSIVSRRGEGSGTVDVNVIVVSGVEVDEVGLDEAMVRMGVVLEGAGVTLGEVVYYEVEGDTFVSAEDEEALGLLRSVDVPGSDQAVNLFVVQDFTEGDGTLGFAAGIPGPIGLRGTAGSGVVLSVDAHLDGDFVFDPGLFGETSAHEIGHQLGLFHTTEAEGTSHDPLPDTPECDAATYDSDGDGEVTAEECDGAGGRNVMFWTSAEFSQEAWSSDQGFVLTRSPALR